MTRGTMLAPKLAMAAMLVLAGCGGSSAGGSDGGAGGGDGGGGSSPSCANFQGNWKMSAWSCAGSPVDIAAFGVEITMAMSSATSGTQTFKFFVPPGQTTTWYARTQGMTVSTAGSDVTFTPAAPVEQCSTNTGATSWGPVTLGTGESDSCTNDTGAPLNPTSTKEACSMSGKDLILSWTSSGNDGPCQAGQVAAQTWKLQ